MIAAWLCLLLAQQPPDAPKAEAPKADAPKADAPKADAPKTDAPKAEAAKDAPRADAGDNVLEEVEPPVAKMKRLPLQPYRIRFWVSPEAHPRLSPALVAAVSDELVAGFKRSYYGAVEVAFGKPPADAAESPGAPSSDMPKAELFAEEAQAADKILWIGLETAEVVGGLPKLVAIAREYDVEFASWSPARRKPAAAAPELPAAALEVAVQQFRARLAVIELGEGKKYRVAVQGLALQPESAPTPLLPPGSPVRLRRDVVRKDVLIGTQPVRFTYVIYRGPEDDRMAGSGNVMSVFRAAIEPSMIRRGRVLGLAMSVSDDARTEVQFVEKQTAIAAGAESGNRPLVAYEVQIRPQDQIQPIALGNTDRRGRATVTAELLAGPDGVVRPRACEVKLRIGNIVIKSFPLVPGDEARMEVVCAPDPDLPEFSGRITALQNEIIASLANFTFKLKTYKQHEKLANEHQEKYNEIDVINLKAMHRLMLEINALPKNDNFLKRLEEMEADAKSRLKKNLGQKNLSKAVGNLFEGLKKVLKDNKIGLDIKFTEPPGFSPNMPDPVKKDPKSKKKTVDVAE